MGVGMENLEKPAGFILQKAENHWWKRSGKGEERSQEF